MIAIFIEGVILLAVLTVLSGKDVVGNDFWIYIKAGLLAFCTWLVSLVIAGGLATVLPPILALVVALAIAAVGLGFAISFLFQIELKRAMLCAGAYFIFTMVARLLMSLVFGG